MSFSRPALDDLIDQALADIDGNLQGTDARLPVSFLSVLAIVTAGQCDGNYGYIADIANQIPWTKADSDVLKRWASLVNIRAKQATAASGIAHGDKCTAGKTLSAGTVLRRADGAEYTVLIDATVAEDGTISAGVGALDPGAAGNCASGVKLALTETVPGIVSPLVVGADGLVGGTNDETDSSLLERFLEYWRGAEEGAGPYVKLAKKVAGVTRAWEYPLEMGLGAVTVRFVMDNKADTIIPTNAEIAIVNDYLQANRPPGSKGLYVVAPIPVPLDLTLAIEPDTAAIRASIEDEVADFIKREHEPGDPTLLSRLSEAISAADGEFAHRIISPADTVNRAFYEIAVPGTITWVAFS